MRSARPQLLAILFLFMAELLCAASSRPEREQIAGTYQGRAPAADAAGRVLTLTLAASGSATLVTEFIGKASATEQCQWQLNARQLTLAFDPIGGNQPPLPIVFRIHHGALVPAAWDHGEWGSAGPPVLHRVQKKALPPNSHQFLPQP